MPERNNTPIKSKGNHAGTKVDSIDYPKVPQPLSDM
jgi:hypothetical protein